MNDPSPFATEQSDALETARRFRAEREVERADLKRILSSELGRVFAMRIIERAGVFRLSFSPDASESTHNTAFNEGRRSEGLRLLNDIIESAPELWQVMLRERVARKAKEAQE